MSDGIEFDEEKAYITRRKIIKDFPEKGIEGFVYNKMPGKYSYKKNMLILGIIIIFLLAFVFFVLGIQNLGSIEGGLFEDRVNNTKSR